jgi:hypothetical protein
MKTPPACVEACSGTGIREPAEHDFYGPLVEREIGIVRIAGRPVLIVDGGRVCRIDARMVQSSPTVAQDANGRPSRAVAAPTGLACVSWACDIEPVESVNVEPPSEDVAVNTAPLE